MAQRLVTQSRGNEAVSHVLLHGFLGSGRNLSSLARVWTDRDPGVGVVLMDLTGHGTSPSLSDEPSLTEVAEDVLHTLDALAIEAANLVGHSFGGRVALEAKRLAPSRVPRVVLLDMTPGLLSREERVLDNVFRQFVGAPDSAPDRATMREHFTDQGMAGPLADWLLLNLESHEGAVRWRVNRERLGALARSQSGQELWDVVDESVQCICGGNSRYVPAKDREEIRARGGRVDVLEGAGHFVHVDALGELVELLVAG